MFASDMAASAAGKTSQGTNIGGVVSRAEAVGWSSLARLAHTRGLCISPKMKESGGSDIHLTRAKQPFGSVRLGLLPSTASERVVQRRAGRELHLISSCTS